MNKKHTHTVEVSPGQVLPQSPYLSCLYIAVPANDLHVIVENMRVVGRQYKQITTNCFKSGVNNCERSQFRNAFMQKYPPKEKEKKNSMGEDEGSSLATAHLVF